jgi:hypothetical protein
MGGQRAVNALELARHWVTTSGQSVIPIGFRSKRPDFRALRWSGSVDEQGRPVWEPFTQRVATDDELVTWFGGGPQTNLAVVTGYAGLVVIDFDSLDAYAMWRQWAEGQEVARLVATATYRVHSARGVHLYVRVQEPVESFSVGAIDVKARWGYVLVPPSVHPSGHVYHAEGEMPMSVQHLADVFPLGPVPREASAPPRPADATDPWDAASQATRSARGSVANIKRALRIEDVLGIPATAYRQVWICCPLHHDTNPSMLVNLEQQHAVCFAGCNGGHRLDAIDMWAALHGCSTREAIMELQVEVQG